MLTTIEPLARRAGTADDRSAAQRRADALGELCEQVLRHGKLPDAGAAAAAGLRPTGRLGRPAVREGALLALRARCSEHLPMSFANRIAAGAAWTGPQTRARIETVLCDARSSRLLLDDLGQVKDLESLTNEVAPAQRRALAAHVRAALSSAAPGHRPCATRTTSGRQGGGKSTLDDLVHA